MQTIRVSFRWFCGAVISAAPGLAQTHTLQVEPNPCASMLPFRARRAGVGNGFSGQVRACERPLARRERQQRRVELKESCIDRSVGCMTGVAVRCARNQFADRLAVKLEK